jgi:hypothetical protein
MTMSEKKETAMAKWESILEKYVHEHPEFLEIGLKWLGDPQARVNFENWLGGPEDVPEEIMRWDNYSHGKKIIDLVGESQNGSQLVICEVKYGGGEGDTAAWQAMEYLLAAQESGEVCLYGRPPVSVKAFRGVSIYLVIAGHVSRLLLQRIALFQKCHPVEFQVFQITHNPTEHVGWKMIRSPQVLRPS